MYQQSDTELLMKYCRVEMIALCMRLAVRYALRYKYVTLYDTKKNAKQYKTASL